MSKLFDGDHSPTVAQAYRITRIRLTPVQSLATIAAMLAEHEGRVQALIKTVSDANDLVLAQAAQVRFDDQQIGRTVIEIARDKRATIAGAKPDEHPSFRTLFPSAPSKGMDGPPDDEQDHYVAVVEAGLDLPQNAALKASRGPELVERKSALSAATAREAELEKAQALEEAKLERATAAARVAFNEAQLDAASILKDQALVASLFDFRREPKKKKKEE